jgi:Colicin V production protein
MTQDLVWYQVILLSIAAFFLAFQAIHGWRLGLVRQLANLGALIAAYWVALRAGSWAMPLFRPFGFPDFLSAALAGSLLAVCTYVVLSSLARIVFLKTGEQKANVLRLTYGAGGAAVGVLFGAVVIWVAVLAIRLLGTVAEAELTSESASKEAPSALAGGLAQAKQSLELGPAGAVVEQVDPIPTEVYSTVGKIGRLVSNAEHVERFLNYPGAKPIAEHPKILALRNDPTIVRELSSRNYIALLRNRHLVHAANDPEVSRLVKNFELQKALDYALTGRL